MYYVFTNTEDGIDIKQFKTKDALIGWVKQNWGGAKENPRTVQNWLAEDGHLRVNHYPRGSLLRSHELIIVKGGPIDLIEKKKVVEFDLRDPEDEDEDHGD